MLNIFYRRSKSELFAKKRMKIRLNLTKLLMSTVKDFFPFFKVSEHGFNPGVTVSPISPIEEKKSPLSYIGGQNQQNLLYFIQRE